MTLNTIGDKTSYSTVRRLPSTVEMQFFTDILFLFNPTGSSHIPLEPILSQFAEINICVTNFYVLVNTVSQMKFLFASQMYHISELCHPFGFNHPTNSKLIMYEDSSVLEYKAVWFMTYIQSVSTANHKTSRNSY